MWIENSKDLFLLFLFTLSMGWVIICWKRLCRINIQPPTEQQFNGKMETSVFKSVFRFSVTKKFDNYNINGTTVNNSRIISRTTDLVKKIWTT